MIPLFLTVIALGFIVSGLIILSKVFKDTDYYAKYPWTSFLQYFDIELEITDCGDGDSSDSDFDDSGDGGDD